MTETEQRQCRICGCDIGEADKRVFYCADCKGKRKTENARKLRLRRGAYQDVSLTCTRCGITFLAKRKDTLFCPTCKKWMQSHRETPEHRRERIHDWQCVDCGVPVVRRAERCRKCAAAVRNGKWVGSLNPAWKGGRTFDKDGYAYVAYHKPDGKRRYRGEHIVVWEITHGHPLPQGWVVHHLNGVKADNRPENLAGMPRHQHHKHPRAALVPYEQRIAHLEQLLRDNGIEPGGQMWADDLHHHDHVHE